MSYLSSLISPSSSFHTTYVTIFLYLLSFSFVLSSLPLFLSLLTPLTFISFDFPFSILPIAMFLYLIPFSFLFSIFTPFLCPISLSFFLCFTHTHTHTLSLYPIKFLSLRIVLTWLSYPSLSRFSWIFSPSWKCHLLYFSIFCFFFFSFFLFLQDLSTLLSPLSSIFCLVLFLLVPSNLWADLSNLFWDLSLSLLSLPNFFIFSLSCLSSLLAYLDLSCLVLSPTLLSFVQIFPSLSLSFYASVCVSLSFHFSLLSCC